MRFMFNLLNLSFQRCVAGMSFKIVLFSKLFTTIIASRLEVQVFVVSVPYKTSFVLVFLDTVTAFEGCVHVDIFFLFACQSKVE